MSRRPSFFHYEHRSQALLPRTVFLRRTVVHGAVAAGLVLGSLAIGVIGYRCVAGLSWVDALLNASMILSGMGPVNELHSTAGKIFASVYAVFSGVVFIATAGILMAPAAHRLMHRLHMDDDEGGSGRR